MELTFLLYLALSFLVGLTAGALIAGFLQSKIDFTVLQRRLERNNRHMLSIHDYLSHMHQESKEGRRLAGFVYHKLENAESVVLLSKTAPVLDDQR